MGTLELARKLEGTQTVGTVMKALGKNRQGAIHAIYRLRKAGYLKTERASGGKRVYKISPSAPGGTSYYDIINKKSPVQLARSNDYIVHGREPGPEEALVFAANSRELRVALASLALFRSISDWKLLYKLAKENGARRKVGALYSLAKTMMKVRSMDKRFLRLMLPKEGESYQYIVPGLRSRNFQDIEKRWKVRLPFNKADLEAYR